MRRLRKLLSTICQLLFLFFLSVLPAKAVDGLEIKGGTSLETLPQFLDRFINVFLIEFMGIGAFITFIVAGFTYLTSGANEQRAATAKKMMFYSVLGLILAVLSYSFFAIAVNILNDIF
jgi:cytochrome bd-type quinol oxidase subunit 2